MKNIAPWLGTLGLVLVSHSLWAAPVEAQKESSPDFYLGKATLPNMVFSASDNENMKFRLGVRFMGTFETLKSSKAAKTTTDFYGRRVRFEAGAQFTKKVKFKMDLRNDKANFQDTGDGTFNVGDAKLVVARPFDVDWLNLAFFRTKVDVSRTETVSSASLIYYDRAHVADFAAEYVSHGRRAMNAQMFGEFIKKISYSLAVGDGVHSSKLQDAAGNKATGISSQSPMIGAKIRVAPLSGWEDSKLSETYFGQGQHFSVGLGVFNTSNIVFTPVTGGAPQTISHTLWNFEASAHYGRWGLEFEYFQFDGMIRDFTVDPGQRGTSQGGYVLAEVCLPELEFFAPFVRLEQWDRFNSDPAYRLISKAVGVNWYLKGNSIKVGAVVQLDDLGASIGNRRDTLFRVTSQIHF